MSRVACETIPLLPGREEESRFAVLTASPPRKVATRALLAQGGGGGREGRAVTSLS